jgi:ketosteroid isomerase-like protein
MLITSPLRAQQVPSTGTLPSELGGSSLAQMRSIADTLAGNWAITWIGKDGKVIGEGEEIWKFAPGESAFVEENRSKVHGQSSEDYAAMWWDAKAHSIRGIWCDPTINDEGCSGFTVTLQGKSVVLTGEWEYLGKRQAWHEVFSRTGTTMTQTLAIADPGDELHQASTIRGTIGRASPSGDEREQIAQLTKLATEAGNAYASRDLERLKRLTADDYVQTDVRGGVLDKEAWLAFVKNRKSDLEVDTDNVRVRLYGDMAIVTGHWKYTRKNDGKITHSQWTSVWSRSPEGWKRHAFQNTYVNANADRCAAEAVP